MLIHAAAGGVGHLAVQLAQHLGAQVTGTSSGTNKEFVRSLGADGHIDYHQYDWQNARDQFDVVLNTIGEDNLDRSIDVAKPVGIVISISTALSDAATEKAKQNDVHPAFMLVQSNGDDLRQMASLLANGTIRAHVSRTIPLAEMAAAHAQVASGRTVGKVVVTV